MGRLLAKQHIRDLLLGAALLLTAAAMVLWPEESVSATRGGLELCGNVIIPSLFPFFVLSSLVVELGLSRYLGRLFQPIMAPLFRVNGACACALALGFVGGYPVGARTAITLYQNGQCSKTEAERLLAFCNNSGPAFILGVVGAGVFGSGQAGLLLYLTHIAASLVVGLLFRFYRTSESPRKDSPPPPQFQAVRAAAVFPRCVTEALTSTLNICAFILCFTVILRLLTLSGVLTALARALAALFQPLGLTEKWATHLLAGLLELSTGTTALTDGGLTGRLSMAAFMLGWAGLSVHCQVLAFLSDSGLSMRTYLIGKFLHGGLSALLLRLLADHFPLHYPVSDYLAEQTESIAALDFSSVLTLSTATAWGTWVVFFLLAVLAVKKSSGNRRRAVV
ncbi:MAG: sporulation protein [Clostridium sp.]|nr:sporulation protein [Clostridium sp.]